jgi:hypothetical protein
MPEREGLARQARVRGGGREGWVAREDTQTHTDTHRHTQTHTDTETLVYISRVHRPQTRRILMLLNRRLTSTDVTHTNVTHTNVTHTNVTHTNVTHTNEPVASVSATDHAEEVTH